MYYVTYKKNIDSSLLSQVFVLTWVYFVSYKILYWFGSLVIEDSAIRVLRYLKSKPKSYKSNNHSYSQRADTIFARFNKNAKKGLPVLSFHKAQSKGKTTCCYSGAGKDFFPCFVFYWYLYYILQSLK